MDARIKVAVRCRPLVSNEPRSVTISKDAVNVGDKRFQFEHVFNETANQQDIYDSCLASMVEGCFQGYNATILAYGQTGSGKTHSIMGAHTDIMADMEPDEEAGIIPRALQQVFHYLHVHQPHHVANVRVSMIEIYNDECKDLLHPEISPRDIMLREDKHGRIFFTGAREEVIQSVREGLSCLAQGNLNRSTAETLMNQASSRSHVSAATGFG
ncbi:hypothetical protein EON65_59320 [archaeon]|nr:MAG: hypothetical protein EON65_59320 [archaeon]